MKGLFLFFFLTLASVSFSQILDTTALGVVAGEKENYIDSSLEITNYYLLNENGRDQFGSISMGNQGDVRRKLIFSNTLQLSPNLGIDGYFKNYKKASSLPYLRIMAPSSGVRYQSGYERGQFFGVDFSISPSKNTNVYIDFQRVNARGNYFNQENKRDNFNFSTYYFSNDLRYLANVSFSWNKSRNFEYGGIEDIRQFEENLQGNRELIPVNLQSSGTVVRSSDLIVNQRYQLTRLKSARLDIEYEFNYLSQYVAFSSGDSIFTAAALFERGTIRDSISLNRFSNKVGVLLEDSTIQLFAGLNHFYSNYGNAYLEQNQNNIALSSYLRYLLGSFKLKADFDYFFTEQYTGTYDFRAEGIYDFNIPISVFFALRNYNSRPGLFNSNFISNNFIWNNDFLNVRGLDVSGGFNYRWLKVSAGHHIFDNWLYFNQQANAAQYNSAATVTYAELRGNLGLSSSWYLDNSIRYQTTNTDEIIRIPNWVIRETFYYQKDIFKRNARLQTGVEFNYFSSFMSEQYMPATSVMFLQDDMEIGNFPYFNYFFNFRIRTFTFFVRLENITQGLFDYNYYAAPGYPLPDFSFRFGATWRFFN